LTTKRSDRRPPHYCPDYSHLVLCRDYDQLQVEAAGHAETMRQIEAAKH
jgi:hypothetical protein